MSPAHFHSSSRSLPASVAAAYDRLRALISVDDARLFSATTLEDVWKAAREVEYQLESRRSLRGFHRIQPLLTGIEKYSGVVEVLCQGTPYLPFIWAPIKLLLQIAQGQISALEQLIDAYAMIGDAMPRFDKLSAAFKDDIGFQQVIGNFYSDILEFHRRAYKFFRQRAWKMLFDSLWKTFNLRFHGILESLRRHRDLIDQEASAMNIAEAKSWRSDQLNDITRMRAERAGEIDGVERERHSSHIREAVAWLGSSEEQEDNLTKILRGCSSEKEHWLLQEKTMVSWLEQGHHPAVLWLNGKPGAGKSVICSRIVEYTREQLKKPIVFYFCSQVRTSQTLVNQVLRDLTTQLLAVDTNLAPYILDDFANNGLRPTTKTLLGILETLIAPLPFIRIVIDGLDECQEAEQEEVIETVLKIKGSKPGSCKILLSSRRLPSISRLLQTKLMIRLEDFAEHTNRDIYSFVSSRFASLRQDFTPEVIDGLERQIMDKAKGMFLWVTLVMFTLENLYFKADLQEVINTLPEEIEILYERIISRMCGHGKTPNQRTAIRILQWMLVAQRPLRRVELESGIALDGRVTQMTTAARARGDVLSLCNPILDVEDGPGGYVSFSHFTALEYLRGPCTLRSLQIPHANMTVSISCTLYLASGLDLVDPHIPNEVSSSAVVQSLHELLLYAHDYWIDHVRALPAIPTDVLEYRTDLTCLQESLERLTVKYNDLFSPHDQVRNEQQGTCPISESHWRLLSISSNLQRMLDRAWVCQSKTPVVLNRNIIKDDQTEGLLTFPGLRKRYQEIVEALLNMDSPDDPILHEFQARHNAGAFLCGYAACPRARLGFDSPDLRQQHEDSHSPRFQCTEPGCASLNRRFNTRSTFRNHVSRYHDDQRLQSVPESLSRNIVPHQQEPVLYDALRSRESVSLDTEINANHISPNISVAFDGTDTSDSEAETEVISSKGHSHENKAKQILEEQIQPWSPISQLLTSEIKKNSLRCICGFKGDDGNTICCRRCHSWQHTECYYINEYGIVPSLRELSSQDHQCVHCHPRVLDVRGAIDRQNARGALNVQRHR